MHHRSRPAPLERQTEVYAITIDEIKLELLRVSYRPEQDADASCYRPEQDAYASCFRQK